MVIIILLLPEFNTCFSFSDDGWPHEECDQYVPEAESHDFRCRVGVMERNAKAGYIQIGLVRGACPQ